MEEFTIRHLLKGSELEQLHFTPLQKELIFKELRYRMRANLNTLSSLFGLQLLYAQRNDDAVGTDLLRSNKRRINIFSLLHETRFSQLRSAEAFESYIRQIIRIVEEESGLQMPLAIEIADDALPESDHMSTIGAIIAELHAASLHLATARQQEETAQLSLFRSEDGYRFVYHLRGDYQDRYRDLTSTDTVAMKLVALHVRQLKGRMTIQDNHGLAVTIVF